MILETDFPDHWKTQLLIKLAETDAAPMLIIRFWLFCQQRRQWRFLNMSDTTLAAICHWPGDAARLRAILLEAGFLEEVHDTDGVWLVAHDFDAVHTKLTSNWRNGPKGGRPRNPTITQPKPNDNPPTNPTVTGMVGMVGSDGMVGSVGSEGSIPPTPASGGSRSKSRKTAKPPIAGILPSDQAEPKRGRMLALNAIFRRPPTDPWSGAEQAALAASGLLEMAELDFVDAAETVRAFYHAGIPREMESRFWRRTTLEKLLANWGGELDKARTWLRERDDGVRKVASA
ncbi:MAG: hypothetical protein NDJ72_05190 [Elusimicrobia bacterium]|nr:hypothetical protein [Elusimicrobiota bacterium]